MLQPFFSLPWEHQYLFTNSPWRCQFALATILFLLKQTHWISWIFSVIELAILSAQVSLSGLFFVNLLQDFCSPFLQFFDCWVHFPGLFPFQAFANDFIFMIRFWSHLWGFCSGSSASFLILFRNSSSSSWGGPIYLSQCGVSWGHIGKKIQVDGQF